MQYFYFQPNKTINHIPTLSPKGDFNKHEITDVITSPINKYDNPKSDEIIEYCLKRKNNSKKIQIV